MLTANNQEKGGDGQSSDASEDKEEEPKKKLSITAFVQKQAEEEADLQKKQNELK